MFRTLWNLLWKYEHLKVVKKNTNGIHVEVCWIQGLSREYINAYCSLTISRAIIEYLQSMQKQGIAWIIFIPTIL